MQVRARVKDKKDDGDDFGKCGCGRSPTGYCNGWHGLTEEQYEEALAQYEANLFDDEDTA